MKIRMRNPEFPLYFIGELGFGIFLFLDSPYKVISLKEKCIMILICVTIWNIVFMISRMRIIIMDKNGCTVKLLLWKKTYKWEDLEIIREDCWNSGRLHLKGIVFSSRRMGKNGKVYSTKKIFRSLQFLNCFFKFSPFSTFTPQSFNWVSIFSEVFLNSGTFPSFFFNAYILSTSSSSNIIKRRKTKVL